MPAIFRVFSDSGTMALAVQQAPSGAACFTVENSRNLLLTIEDIVDMGERALKFTASGALPDRRAARLAELDAAFAAAGAD